jgi:hypothetical protein
MLSGENMNPPIAKHVRSECERAKDVRTFIIGQRTARRFVAG